MKTPSKGAMLNKDASEKDKYEPLLTVHSTETSLSALPDIINMALTTTPETSIMDNRTENRLPNGILIIFLKQLCLLWSCHRN